MAEPDDQALIVPGQRRRMAYHGGDAGERVTPGCAPSECLARGKYLVIGQLAPDAIIGREHDQGRIRITDNDPVLGIHRLKQVGRAGH